MTLQNVKNLHKTNVYKDREKMDLLPLRGNQWIPLGIHTSLNNRIDISAVFDNFCNGGSILHCNVDAPFATEEQAWDMLNYITNKGVTYFAFNGKMSSCENQHLFYGDVCPECHCKKNAEYTRTVGFYTKMSTWSTPRKQEGQLREWLPLNKMGIEA